MKLIAQVVTTFRPPVSAFSGCPSQARHLVKRNVPGLPYAMHRPSALSPVHQDFCASKASQRFFSGETKGKDSPKKALPKRLDTVEKKGMVQRKPHEKSWAYETRFSSDGRGPSILRAVAEGAIFGLVAGTLVKYIWTHSRVDKGEVLTSDGTKSLRTSWSVGFSTDREDIQAGTPWLPFHVALIRRLPEKNDAEVSTSVFET